jgi:Gpi18-like mannosyltransferase
MSDDGQRTWKSHRVAGVVVALVMVVHTGVLLNVAFNTCVTHDEYWHIPVGLWNLTHGEFHYDNLNPPLPRVLSAIPLVIAGAETGDVADDADKETRADTFVAANHDRYSRLISLSRLSTIAVSLFVAGLLASWALELFGPGAAVTSVILWCFSPNVLANAPLVTSDVPAACAMLLVIRAAWKYAERPTWRRALWLGFWFGVAQLVKFTCILAAPMIIAIWWVRRCGNGDCDKQKTSVTAKQWAALLLVTILTVNMGFLFRGTGRPLNEFKPQSQSMTAIQRLVPWTTMPVPLPADYIEGIDHQRTIMEQLHPVYLNGKWSFEGFRSYYLYTLWYKTPHATQILAAVSLLVTIWPSRSHRNFRLQAAILLPVLLLTLVASLSHMQLGHRYLLPVFPFLFLFAGQVASVGVRRIGLPQFLAIAATFGLASTLRCHPHYLSYFNELSGGPETADTLLVDSNLDWGQDLFELRDFVKEHDVQDLRLAYFGMVNPVDLGIPYSLPNNDSLRPGWYAISVNFVRGGPHTIRHPDGRYDAVMFNTFGWFRLPEIQPVATIGHSIRIYNLSAANIQRVNQVLAYLKQQGVPVPTDIPDN